MVKVARFLKGSQMPAHLQTSIDAADKIRIAVAFLKDLGYSQIEGNLRKALARGKEVEFIVGACPAYHITEPIVLEKLKALENSHKNLTLRFFSEPYFHPKIFVFEKQRNIKVVLGSSNLTSGGIGSNIEANVALEGNRDEAAIHNILRFFENEILDESSELTNRWIKEYNDYYKKVKRTSAKIRVPRWKKGKPRSRAKPTRRDWKTYPHPKKILDKEEKEELVKRIKAIPQRDWNSRYCYDFAEEYKTNSHQIRGLKAWAHHPHAWDKVKKRVRAS